MDGLYLVTIEALPLPGSEESESYGGAYINVYTKDQSEADALATAGREVTEAGWVSRSVENIEFVTREDFAEEDDGIEYFDQALVDGIVVVVHTYPNEPGEDDVRH